MDDGSHNIDGGATSADTGSANESSSSGAETAPTYTEQPPGQTSAYGGVHEADRVSTDRTDRVPRPELVGQYDSENVLSYFPESRSGDQQSGDQQAFDLNGSFNAFMRQPEAGAFGFLEGMYNSNEQTYARFVSDAVLSQPEYALAVLAQQMPELAEFVPRPNAVDPDDPDLADLSPELRDVALNLDPQMWAEITLMAPDLRDQLLERAGALQRIGA